LVFFTLIIRKKAAEKKTEKGKLPISSFSTSTLGEYNEGNKRGEKGSIKTTLEYSSENTTTESSLSLPATTSLTPGVTQELNASTPIDESIAAQTFTKKPSFLDGNTVKIHSII
jgi:hypothetical protein